MKTRIGFVSNSSSSSFVIMVERDKLERLLAGQVVDNHQLTEWERILLNEFKKMSHTIHSRVILGNIREFSGSTWDNLVPFTPPLNEYQQPRFVKEFNTEDKMLCEWDETEGWQKVWDKLIDKFKDGQTIAFSIGS